MLSFAIALATRAGAATNDLARLIAETPPESSARALDARAEELARLPGALAAYFALAEVDETRELHPLGAQILARTAVRFAPIGVIEHVRQGLLVAPDDAWRRTALELLGMHASPNDLGLLARVVLESRDGEPRPALVEPFLDALTSILRHHGSQPHKLSWLVDDAPPLAPSVVRAVGRAGDPEGLLWLVTRLDDPLHGAIALQELGRLAPSASDSLAAEVSAGLFPILRGQDEGRRKHAIRALGALGDPASIPVLALLLDRATSNGERRMTANALRQISGIELPAVGAAWLRWFEAEQRWLAEEGPVALERLASEDDLVVAAAVQELSARTLYKDRIAAELAARLGEHSSPAIRARVCIAMARLGGGAAAAALRDALRDRDADVRWAARRALQALGIDEVRPPERAEQGSSPVE